MQSIPKFVINLKRRPDRLKQFYERCPFTDVIAMNAFDGRSPQDEPEDDLKRFSKLNCNLSGEKALFVSHLRIYQEIVNKGYSSALIFEDDAEFCESFLKKYVISTKHVPDDFDLLYIGGRFAPHFTMNPSTYIQTARNLVKYRFDIPWDGHTMDRTTHAYIISNSAAKRLLEQFHSSYMDNTPIDHWIMRFFARTTKQIYSVLPLLCHSPMVSDSDIR